MGFGTIPEALESSFASASECLLTACFVLGARLHRLAFCQWYRHKLISACPLVFLLWWCIERSTMLSSEVSVSDNAAGCQLTASCWEHLWTHLHKTVHSAFQLHWNPISWPSAKLFILPPVYSACLAARQRLESTRSEGISPQVDHWSLGKKGFHLGGRGMLLRETRMLMRKSFFSCWYMLIFLNRKYRVDSKSEGNS